ncbi:MAG: hypothetical protein M0Q48_05245 [Verrucomicrobia bacterium]|nr:hypothetical protein [Verrucomicrobiota bacterium]
MKRILLGLSSLLLVMLFAGSALCVSAQSEDSQNTYSQPQAYTVTGSMRVVGSPFAEKTLTVLYSFTLYRTIDNWKIRMKEEEGFVQSGTEQSPYTSGIPLSEYGLISPTNSYELSIYEPSEKEYENDCSLYLYYQEIPNGHVVPIWFAFIGGSYLGHSGKGDIDTPFSQRGEFFVQRSTLPAEWKFHSLDATYPMVASYVDYPVESKETKNQTNACYEVLSWTNALGQSFPQIAKASKYYGPKNDLRCDRYDLQIESVEPGVPKNIFQFEVPSKTQVYDLRILLEDYNTPVLYDYFSKTGEIRSIETILADPRFNDLAANAKVEANAPKRDPRWIYGILFVLFVVPLTLVIRKFFK